MPCLLCAAWQLSCSCWACLQQHCTRSSSSGSDSRHLTGEVARGVWWSALLIRSQHSAHTATVSSSGSTCCPVKNSPNILSSIKTYQQTYVGCDSRPRQHTSLLGSASGMNTRLLCVCWCVITRLCVSVDACACRFKASPHGVLVATDVAARGLDVPGVQVCLSRRDSIVHHSLC